MRPRNAAGQVDLVNGKVVLISIGMSNTTQEFRKFIQTAGGYANLNSKLVIVDGAQGGKDASAWASYPNLALGHVASRIYTCDPLRSAGAYQQGWADRKLIQDQINGASNLAYGTGGVAPWLSWGPYMWADGLGSDGVAGGIPGRSDGLEWACSDLESDRVHPGPTGEQKVADLILNQFSTDSTTTPWLNK
ncbi:hypothetical protein [Streptomyces sp. NPDC002104]